MSVARRALGQESGSHRPAGGFVLSQATSKPTVPSVKTVNGPTTPYSEKRSR